MNPKSLRPLQIFIILFLSSLTLYVLFKEADKPIEETLILKPKEQREEVQENSTKSSKTSYSLKIKKEKLTPPQLKAVQQFEEIANSIVEKLPKKQDLQELKEGEVHSIPQELLETGRELGRLKELVLRYPDFKELQSKAKSFYKGCADDEDYPTSIRSLCLFNRLQLAKNNGEKFDISPYPLEIKQLVLELNPF